MGSGSGHERRTRSVELIGRKTRRAEPPRIAAILAVLGWTVVPVVAFGLGWCVHLIVASEPGTIDPELLSIRVDTLRHGLIREAREDLASAVTDLDVRNITLARESLEKAVRKLDVAQLGDPARRIPERAVAQEALRLVGSDDPADWQEARLKLAETIGVDAPLETESPGPIKSESEA